jgi:uncharacterized SAM-binding protein YcdF (DUF218 family)
VIAVLRRALTAKARGIECDVIVVLGAALAPDGRLGPALEERVVAGAAAWHAGRAPLVIMTGAKEAGAMRARAVELGVPADVILLERTARTTRENATATTVIMRRRGLARALIVTQPYHSRRSVSAFRRAGVEAEPLGLPARDRWWPVLREVVALASYAARGWLA